MAFDLDRIQRETFVAGIDFHEEIGSTNTYALAVAANTPSRESLPRLVLAERQTAGRGRGGNRWWAGDGALTFSLVLRTGDYDIPAVRSPWLSLTAGLAVAEALAAQVPGAEVHLKWPNDVLLNGRKTCGVLLETTLNPATLVVIGIGLNVNSRIASAPPELHSIATSLAEVAGRTFDRTTILICVLQRLAQCLTLFHDDYSELAERWRRRCYLQGRTVRIHQGPNASRESITGVCHGIDDEGGLLLQTETGMVRCLSGVIGAVL
jgi:BirA family biotin operon repressor/biotin-[acetyl-CoA-carboxylase] ligase